jgi:glc operon protein GlcG
MHRMTSIAVSEALVIVQDAVRSARERHGDSALVACAVVGAHGELVAYAAADGLGPLPRRLAARKAYTAVLLKRATSGVRTAVHEGMIDLDRLADADLIAIPGGIPILAGGLIVGAVGVSGLAPDDDEALAAHLVQGALVVAAPS